MQPNKKKGKPPTRLVHAEESASRHRAHVQRLEQVWESPSRCLQKCSRLEFALPSIYAALLMQILRLLDNETIEAEDISEAKEMVDDYMSRNQEDFDDFSAPDDLYADLLDQLDNLEVSTAFVRCWLFVPSTITWKRHVF